MLGRRRASVPRRRDTGRRGRTSGNTPSGESVRYPLAYGAAGAGVGVPQRWLDEPGTNGRLSRRYATGIAGTSTSPAYGPRIQQQAIQAAGVSSKRRRWSHERIINDIRSIYGRSPQGSIRRGDPSLATAAGKYFGTLTAAKLAAGIPPDANRWSKERVIECIQDLHVKRTPLTPASRHDPRLVSAAKRYFGSWGDALVAAGVLRTSPDRTTSGARRR